MIFGRHHGAERATGTIGYAEPGRLPRCWTIPAGYGATDSSNGHDPVGVSLIGTGVQLRPHSSTRRVRPGAGDAPNGSRRAYTQPEHVAVCPGQARSSPVNCANPPGDRLLGVRHPTTESARPTLSQAGPRGRRGHPSPGPRWRTRTTPGQSRRRQGPVCAPRAASCVSTWGEALLASQHYRAA